MIVEDDPATCNALRMILKRKGWDVAVATRLAEGMDLLGTAPRCVILDLMLPDGNGRAILEDLHRRGASTRVIVTTGSNNELELNAVRALKPAGILRKPIDLGELLDLMSA